MAQITKQTLIGEILQMDESSSKFFLEMGMHCLGCPASQSETLEQACQAHHVDPDQMTADLNAYLSRQK